MFYLTMMALQYDQVEEVSEQFERLRINNYLTMMALQYYQVEEVFEQFERLRINNTKRKGRNRYYDELYLPKAEKVKYYVDSSPNRASWLKHPNEQIPSKWYIELIPGTKQYNKVVGPLKAFIGKKCQIVEVDKVFNRYLERQYLLKKTEKEQFAPCKEFTMYHFTKESYLDSIILNNFNWRFSGSSRGHKYGYGISFSPDPSFAEQFCKNKEKYSQASFNCHPPSNNPELCEFSKIGFMMIVLEYPQ
ncbi:uncharacterized protein LOC123679892 [Harmonia axyridis]|uniref:uncharacterized protein LOC123679892 n=1 Tax=Harmonia axyridis TaxID=115357 RepID=UPI001E2755BA|nr:uncharacterized protein LOC123679892 [Harmonia axyridis]